MPCGNVGMMVCGLVKGFLPFMVGFVLLLVGVPPPREPEVLPGFPDVPDGLRPPVPPEGAPVVPPPRDPPGAAPPPEGAPPLGAPPPPGDPPRAWKEFVNEASDGPLDRPPKRPASGF